MHFQDEHWVDYVRKIGDSQRQGAMQQHLNEGCVECLDTERFWNEIYLCGQREADYAPVERAVQGIRESVWLSPVGQPSFVVQVVNLIFDSALQHSAVGLRTCAAGSRMLLYQSGDLRIDMRMERRRANRMNLVGQILDMHSPDQMVGHAPVALVEGSRSLARTCTNELGEFQLEVPMNRNVCVALEVEGKQLLIALGVTDSKWWNASE